MNHINISTIFLLLFILSCTSLVKSEFEAFEQTIIVNTILQPEDEITVNISKSFSLQSNDVPFVANAEVVLFEGSNQQVLNYSGDGNYSSGLIAKQDVIYGFSIQVPGVDSIYFEKKIPTAEKLLNIEHIANYGIDEEGVITPAIKLTIENRPDQDLYYHAIIKMIEVYYNDTIVSEIQLEELEEPLLVREGIPVVNFTNAGTSGDNITIIVPYSTGQTYSFDGSTYQMALFPLIVELRSGDEEYYEFVRQQYLYENSIVPELDGGNSSLINAYYTTYAPNIIGTAIAYSSIVSDTTYTESTNP